MPYLVFRGVGSPHPAGEEQIRRPMALQSSQAEREGWVKNEEFCLKKHKNLNLLVYFTASLTLVSSQHQIKY
jgi:hypothetical protein